MSGGQVVLTSSEVYRVNRQRLAREYGLSPREIDEWPALDYYDALAVMAADNELTKLRMRG